MSWADVKILFNQAEESIYSFMEVHFFWIKKATFTLSMYNTVWKKEKCIFLHFSGIYHYVKTSLYLPTTFKRLNQTWNHPTYLLQVRQKFIGGKTSNREQNAWSTLHMIVQPIVISLLSSELNGVELIYGYLLKISPRNFYGAKNQRKCHFVSAL